MAVIGTSFPVASTAWSTSGEPVAIPSGSPHGARVFIFVAAYGAPADLDNYGLVAPWIEVQSDGPFVPPAAPHMLTVYTARVGEPGITQTLRPQDSSGTTVLGRWGAAYWAQTGVAISPSQPPGMVYRFAQETVGLIPTGYAPGFSGDPGDRFLQWTSMVSPLTRGLAWGGALPPPITWADAGIDAATAGKRGATAIADGLAVTTFSGPSYATYTQTGSGGGILATGYVLTFTGVDPPLRRPRTSVGILVARA